MTCDTNKDKDKELLYTGAARTLLSPAGEHESRLDDGEEHHPPSDLQELLRNLLLPDTEAQTKSDTYPIPLS